MDKEPDRGALIALPTTEFEALLERAAETGARRALHEVGLDGQDAAEDIRDLRSLLAGFRLGKGSRLLERISFNFGHLGANSEDRLDCIETDRHAWRNGYARRCGCDSCLV
ncbi:DUF6127 family protein [Cereibacter johrii]|uniref:DUF6127 family protein n=1 Tax=Cereibacter johrii TaxID=445629 RepID=UPI001F286935|nr:DUF6127 family protein [Cereibacter johrii]